MADSKKIVNIYTDGACSGNPGPGGWGALLEYEGVCKEINGGEAETTNNRMELMAAIKSIESIKYPCEINLYTDSTYVKDGITKWINNWKAKNWRTANRKPVKNVDLWKLLDIAVSNHDIKWHWVKGHSGHRQNDRADELARNGIVMNN